MLAALQGKKVPGRRVAVLTETGDAGIMAADICQDFGLSLPPLGDDTVARMRKVLPEFASVINPIDFTAQVGGEDGGAFRTCLTEVSRDPAVDVLLFSFGPILGPVAEQYGDDVIDIFRASEKPIFVSWLSPEQPVFTRLRSAGVPLYSSPRRCIQAIDHLAGKKKNAERHEATSASAEPCTPDSLTEFQAKALLSESGVNIPRGGLATSAQEALQLASQTTYPLVMKLMSPHITHKTDAGLVLLDIGSPAEVEQGYAELHRRAAAWAPKAVIQGVLVEEMLSPPVAELIIGIKNDRNFGPVLIVGLGGIFVEILKDVVRRVLPLESKDQAMEMLRDLKAFPLLTGYRGKPHGDMEALADLLMAVSRFAMENKDRFNELDINPVFLMPEGLGCICADAVIIRT